VTVYDEIGLAVFRQTYSKDGCWGVTVCNPPAMSIWVGEHLMVLPEGHPTMPRTDIVSVDRSGRSIRVTNGTPSPDGIRPALPAGDVAMAVVRVPIGARVVTAEMIEPLPVPTEREKQECDS
jgi:hypothetical protein